MTNPFSAKTKPDCHICSAECLLQEIGDQHLIDELNKRKTIIRIKKNQIIFEEGDEVHDIMFIQSGVVKVFKPGILNRIQIVRFSSTGDILGHRGLNTTHYPVSAIAVEDCIVCKYPRDYFLDLIKTNMNLAVRLMFFYADELTKSEIRERNLAQMNVRGKVADVLLSLKEKFGVDENKLLKIYLSRQDMADYAGTTKEQVSKVLSEFNQENIIAVDSKRIHILNPSQLSKLRSI